MAMTNYLGKDVYGNIVWIIATLSTLNIVSDLGFGSAHIKRLSEGQNENDCFSTYFTIRFALTMFMAVFVLTVMLLWNDVLEGGMSPATWNLVILFLLYFIMYDLSYIVIFTFEAKMQTTRAQLILMLDPLIRVPLIIFISLNHLADDIAYAYVLASIGVLLFSLFLVKRSELRWVRPTLFRSYLKFALPLSLIAIAGAVTDNLDKITSLAILARPLASPFIPLPRPCWPCRLSSEWRWPRSLSLHSPNFIAKGTWRVYAMSPTKQSDTLQ